MQAGSDQLRVVFEASSLRQAVEIASELRVRGQGRIQIRAAPRLLTRRWHVIMLVDRPVRVLIVDDSAPFRRAVRQLLRRRGYLVVGEAASAAAAHDAVERVVPDALLLDVGLPDACGFELAAALTRTRPELAVLLVSASDPTDRDRRLSASGARGFVPKSRLAATQFEEFWRTPSP